MMQDTRQRRKWLLHSRMPGYCASMICLYKGDAADVTIEDPDAWLAAHLTPPQPQTEEMLGLREFLSIELWAERDMPSPDRLLGDLVTTTTRTFLVGQSGLGKTMLARRWPARWRPVKTSCTGKQAAQLAFW